MNLIIDGNYILYKNVFSLIKDGMLYGLLHETLQNVIIEYSRWHSFNNIYFVSDSVTNWRKQMYSEYKANRKKDEEIDWEFVQNTYSEFKQSLSKNKRFRVLEKRMAEGDDWISFLVKGSNKSGVPTLIVSNDGDLKQLLVTGEKFINVMVNENHKHNYIYLPEDYRTWLYEFSRNTKLPTLMDDEPEEETRLYDFINKMISERTIKKVNPQQVLFEKIVSGDRGDNIKPVWGKTLSNGSFRGIGEKTATKIYDKYIEYFGTPTFNETCFDRMSDIIIELKDLESSEFDSIRKNIDFNNKLVNLDMIPKDIIKSIKEEYINVNQ